MRGSRFNFRLVMCAVVLSASVSQLDAQTAATYFQKSDHIVFVGNTFTDVLRHNGYLETMLTTRHPKYELYFRSLGWAGDTLSIRARPHNFSTMDQDLATHMADVVVICAGMGESFAGQAGVDAFTENLTQFIEHLRGQQYNGKSAPRIVLISPIACEDLGDLSPQHDKRRKDLALYVDVMRKVAEAAKVKFVDVFGPTSKLMDKGARRKLTFNGIHLTKYGYWVVSRMIADALAPATDPWRIGIDAKSGKAQVSGVEATLVKSGDVISFQLREAQLPLPSAPANHADQTMRAAPRLSVKNLKPGQYTLLIDGTAVMTADDKTLSSGIPIVHSPSLEKVEKLRAAIMDKNQAFFHRWRALNSVHILGQRKTSSSGKALPGELKEMDAIIEKKDQKIGPLAFPAPSQVWKLVRTGD